MRTLRRGRPCFDCICGLREAAFVVLLVTLVAPRALAADAVLKATSPEKTIALTAEEPGILLHTALKEFDPHERREHVYSGVPVHDLLARVDTPFGEKLRGPALALAVVARSRDGYAALFALAEFNDAFSRRTLLLADSEDGVALPPNSGPFRLIVSGDKRVARWARMVTSIEVVQLLALTP